MKPIDQMTLAECIEVLQSAEGDAFVGMRLNISALADRIHELIRWIPVSERMPTEEDADRYGLVLKWDSITGSVQVDSWNHFGTHNVCFTHWKLTTPPEGV